MKGSDAAFQSPEPDDLVALLDRAAGTLSRVEPVLAGNAPARLAELQRRLGEGRFHLAVLGQFKRGKSTLINALIGDRVLPTSVVPLTAIPTYVRAGTEPRAVVHFNNDTSPTEVRPTPEAPIDRLLSRWIAETENPGNRLAVRHVEVFHPAAFLRNGLVLIDTPGIGSTHRHNTEATLNFLPHCDAALFVVSADPPITEVELGFLKEVRGRVSRIMFVLNKADYLSGAERAMVTEFLRTTLHEKAGLPADTRIYCVSARAALDARLAGRPEPPADTGLPDIDARLTEFARHEKFAALREAVARQAADSIAAVGSNVSVAIRSLMMPAEELDRRTALFEKKVVEAERQRVIASDRLAGDRTRMVALLEQQAETLRQRARRTLRQTAQAAMEKSGWTDESAAREALEAEVPAFFEKELGDMSRAFDQQVATILDEYRQKADSIAETVRRHAADLFEITYRVSESVAGLTVTREPYWVTHQWSSSLSPLPPGVLDRFAWPELRRRRIMQRVLAQIEELVVRNVENLRWATLQNLDTTFRRFMSDLDERLRSAAEATRGAIRAAVERRRDQSIDMAAKLAPLNALKSELETLERALTALAPRRPADATSP